MQGRIDPTLALNGAFSNRHAADQIQVVRIQEGSNRPEPPGFQMIHRAKSVEIQGSDQTLLNEMQVFLSKADLGSCLDVHEARIYQITEACPCETVAAWIG